MVHLVKFNPIQNGVFILVEVSFRILTTDETWYPGGVNLSCLTGVIGCACTYTCQVTRLPRAGGISIFHSSIFDDFITKDVCVLHFYDLSAWVGC